MEVNQRRREQPYLSTDFPSAYLAQCGFPQTQDEPDLDQNEPAEGNQSYDPIVSGRAF